MRAAFVSSRTWWQRRDRFRQQPRQLPPFPVWEVGLYFRRERLRWPRWRRFLVQLWAYFA